ncbi:EI24 domain-containing protein [Belnapia sp. T6]|uniref:EI24 domain-containing protein n=1 Tax=Belnapia mucosa TaxID=2804532 RepID=A0ABS1V907_9PROT|nr:EI24 domain-containing protein [Belnapia mucosa]MBL6458145.1 EI24 domain-containing protein [Belnapia mucosa]
MLTACLLALRQLGDPSFLGPLAKAFGAALLAFLGLAALAAWGVSTLAGGTGWLAGLAGAFGGLMVLALAIWLFVPVMLALSGLFLDPVAAAVERRFYGGLPPALGASLFAQAGFNLRLGVKTGVLALAALPLLAVAPPIGAILLWVISTVALGHGLFEGVAQRRMPVAAAAAERRRREVPVLGIGALLAGLALVPGLNLLVPVLGTAAMTHLLHRNRNGVVKETADEFRR